MDEAMTDHLILSLESLPTFATRATFNAAIMGPVRGMYIGVRV